MRTFPLGFTALCLASPLAAQDGSGATPERTVQTAQDFLQKIIELGGVTIEVGIEDQNSWNSYTSYSNGPHLVSWPAGAIGSAAPVVSKPCQTTFSAKFVLWARQQDNGATIKEFSPLISTFSQGFKSDGYLGSGNLVLDWSAVNNVSREGPYIYMLKMLRFKMPSVDIAERTHSAIDYLRSQCDQTKNLAF